MTHLGGIIAYYHYVLKVSPGSHFISLMLLSNQNGFSEKLNSSFDLVGRLEVQSLLLLAYNPKTSNQKIDIVCEPIFESC